MFSVWQYMPGREFLAGGSLMKKTKIMTMFLTMTITMSVGSFQAFAAPETMPDETVFDAEYYADQNPDVTAVLGRDADALYQHYVLVGKSEGRNPVVPPKKEYRGALSYQPHYTDVIYLDYIPEDLHDGEFVAWMNARLGIDPDRDMWQLEKDILNKVGITDGMSNREKIRRAHDYLCKNHVYGEETYNIRGGYLSNYVCHNYAKDFYDILAVAGVQVEYVSGGDHAWNRVWLDGDYRYIDVCWDDGTDSERYYLITYDQMEKDHTQEYVGTP